IRSVFIEVIRLQIAISWGQGTGSVISQHDRLGVFELGKYLGLKSRMHLRAVALAGGEACPVRCGLARKDAHAGLLARFGERIAGLQHLLLAAEPAGGLGAEVVAQGEEDLGAKSLEERPPALTRQARPERADALRR